MKKIVSYVITFMLTAVLLLSGKVPVMAAGSISVSVNKSTVKIGDTVTVSLKITSGYGAQGIIQRSSDALGGSSDTLFTIGGGTGDTKTFNFKASAAGTCTFSVVVYEAYDSNVDDTKLSVGSATVKVTEPSSENTTNPSGGSKPGNSQGTGNKGDDDKNDGGQKTDKKDEIDEKPALSSDSSLGSLVISGGSLSPKFSSGTKEYRTTVDYSVTNLAVSASARDAKAKVTSVSGNDDLAVGENTVKIVVTAENGATSTYTIKVTRRAKTDPENTDQKENWKKFDIGGSQWTVVNEIPEDLVPEDFEHTKTVIDGLEYNSLHAGFGDLTLLYLKSDSGSGLFVYDDTQNAAYEYVRILSESHFIVLLLADVNLVPEGYQEVTLSIEGKGVATAYQPEQENSNKDFYLVYGMNDQGTSGWYLYDSAEGTYIRNQFSVPEAAAPADTQAVEPTPGKKAPMWIFPVILVGIFAVLGIVLLVVVIRNRKK